MTTQRLTIMGLTGVLGAACTLALSAPAALAETVPLQYDLGVVLPGQTHSLERPLEVTTDMTVVAAEFDSTSADAQWDAKLCVDSASCWNLADMIGEKFAAGDYTLVVDLTVAADADPSVAMRADGSITMVEAGTSGSVALPATGGSVAFMALLAGFAFATVGGILFAASRRRRATASEDRS